MMTMVDGQGGAIIRPWTKTQSYKMFMVDGQILPAQIETA
jgi:hypothetical protein